MSKEKHRYVFSSPNRFHRNPCRDNRMHPNSFMEMVELGQQVDSDNLAAGNHSSGTTRMVRQMQDTLEHAVKIAVRQGKIKIPKEEPLFVSEIDIPTEIPGTSGNGDTIAIERFYSRLEKTQELRNKIG